MPKVWKKILQPISTDALDFVGVPAVIWNKNWGAPTIAFVEVDTPEPDLMTPYEKQIYDWALKQVYPSVAASDARTLALYIERNTQTDYKAALADLLKTASRALDSDIELNEHDRNEAMTDLWSSIRRAEDIISKKEKI